MLTALPGELLYDILEYLHFEDTIRCRAVNVYLCNVIDTHPILVKNIDMIRPIYRGERRQGKCLVRLAIAEKNDHFLRWILHPCCLSNPRGDESFKKDRGLPMWLASLLGHRKSLETLGSGDLFYHQENYVAKILGYAGHRGLLASWVQRDSAHLNLYAMNGAVKGGHLDLVRCLWFQTGFENRHLLSIALRGGHLGVIDWVWKRVRNDRFLNKESMVSKAARGGHLSSVLWCAAHGFLYPENGFHGACKGGHIDLMMWFLDRGAITPGDHSWKEGLWGAVEHARFHVIEWFMRKDPTIRPQNVLVVTMDGRNGPTFRVMEWLWRDKNMRDYQNEAMMLAVRRNYLAAVQWLAMKREEEFGSKTLRIHFMKSKGSARPRGCRGSRPYSWIRIREEAVQHRCFSLVQWIDQQASLFLETTLGISTQTIATESTTPPSQT